MARNYAQLRSAIWQNESFKNELDVDAQWLYFVLLSQPNINTAGVLPLQERRWARFAHGMTGPRVTAALERLNAYWYVVVDEDTEEVLVRTFIRHDGLWKQPNVLKSALGHVQSTVSPTLRAVLRYELSRLPIDELPTERAERTRALIERVAGTLPETLPEGFLEGFPEGFPEGSPNPFHQPISDPNPNHRGGDSEPLSPKTTKQQVSEPQQAALEGFPEGFREGFREGFPEGSGVGVGVGVKGEGCLLVQEREPKTTSSGAAAPHTPPVTAQTLIGEWLDRCPKRPPSRVIGHVAKEIKTLLDDGIHPDDIRRGLAHWMTKGLHPSTLPSVVNEVMNTPNGSNVVAFPDARPLTYRQQNTQAMFADALAEAEQLERAMQEGTA